MKKNIKWLIVVLLSIVFIFLSYNVKTNEYLQFDKTIYNLLYFSNLTTIIMKLITFMGSKYVVILVAILILIKNKKYGIYISINLILITTIQIVLKNIFLRERPIDINIIEETGYSFPSGHSLTAMAFYGFIIYLIYKSNIKNKKIYIFLLGILIFLIGISRIYLGVHFATDVIAGFIISIIFLICYTHILERKDW